MNLFAICLESMCLLYCIFITVKAYASHPARQKPQNRETTLCIRRCGSRVRSNTRKILMFERFLDLQILRFSSTFQVNQFCTAYWTAWNILNHLDTSLSNDLGFCPSTLTIKHGIRLSKALTGRQLSAEKRSCNCCSKTSIKGMSIDPL